MLNKSLYSSNKSVWETPRRLFDSLDREFSFTLDVCADQTNAKIKQFFTETDDGLAQKWVGVCWMNPPYGRGIDKWVRKAWLTAKEGHTCVCLLPVRSDTRWWHSYVMESSEIRLLTKRLSFEGAGNKAPFPAAIVVFRPDSAKPLLRSLEV